MPDRLPHNKQSLFDNAIGIQNVKFIDTLKHTDLLNRLQSRFGVQDDALKWIVSYLNDREQYMAIGQHTSKPHPLAMCVPKGSAAGPILVTLYMAPLADIIEEHGLNSHFCADDSQLYTFFEPSNGIDSVRATIKLCESNINLKMQCFM